MSIPRLLLLCGICLGLIVSGSSTPAGAAATVPASVHISITKPLTPITDVIALLAKQTGQTILIDDTVVAPVGTADLQAPTLDEMLTSLKSLDAGLVWHKLYLPKDAPLPTGNDLSTQVRALQAIAAVVVVVADPARPLLFSHKQSDTAAAITTDMRMVYLVTDESVRNDRLAAKAAEAQPLPPGGPGLGGMQSAAVAFSQMTPDQQRQALPVMLQQFQAMMQNMDPSLRAEVRQGMRGWMRGGGGRGGAGGGFGNGQ